MCNCGKLFSILLIILILAFMLNGCAILRVGPMLLQHATGPYDPTDQIAEDQLNAILKAVEAQDAAAIKAQFAPNAIAAQPELDDQIEALGLLCRWGGGSGDFFPTKRRLIKGGRPNQLFCYAWEDYRKSNISRLYARRHKRQCQPGKCWNLDVPFAPCGRPAGLS